MARKSNTYFQFKQFRVDQGQCAMKVTMDACLFGALVSVEESRRILDIGTGTGLLSLMAAQRSLAHIDAIELDDNAARQARLNVAQSPWSDQITVIKSAIQRFSGTPDGYDTIICNPPFFENSLKAPDKQRNMARHTCNLSFDELAQAINHHLTHSGKAWVLLPVLSTSSFLKAIESYSELKSDQIISIRSKPERQDHRHVLTITKNRVGVPGDRTPANILIHTETGGYSDRVKELLSGYYLNLLV